MPMERVLLFNVGWMKHYRGQTTTDRIINGGMYVAEHEDGGEVTNFRPLGSRCYGYARSPRGGRIHIVLRRCPSRTEARPLRAS